jgi:hypothetical protein
VSCNVSNNQIKDHECRMSFKIARITNRGKRGTSRIIAPLLFSKLEKNQFSFARHCALWSENSNSAQRNS